MRSSRRSVLQGAGAGLVSLAGCSGEQTPSRYERGPLHDALDPLARAIAEAEQRHAFDVVARHLRDGGTLFDVFRAVLSAAAADLRVDSGGWLHCVLAANAALRVTAAFADRDRLVPVLWWVDRFKRSQYGTEGSRRLDPLGTVPSPAEAGPALERAFEAWDAPAAEAASAALVRAGDRRTLLLRLQTYALRDQHWVGHTAIHAAQLGRALALLGWNGVEAPVRQLVGAILFGKPGPTTASFEMNRPRAAALPAGWDQGTYDDAAAAGMVSAARAGSPDDLSRHVISALDRRVAPDALWDGLCAYAAELMIRGPEGSARVGGLHALTTVDALRKIADDAVDDSIRRLALLQAASWMALFREYVAAQAARATMPVGSADLVGLEASAAPTSADDLLQLAANDPLAGARAAIAWIEAGRGLDAIATPLLRQAVRRSRFDEHDCKFPVASWIRPRAPASAGSRASSPSSPMAGRAPRTRTGRAWRRRRPPPARSDPSSSAEGPHGSGSFLWKPT
jgi:hypothetical protein